MWQCPSCDEQHDDVFDVCWKCGSDPVSNRDMDFHIAEPVREQDQAPDPPADETLFPFLQVPLANFSVPPDIWRLLRLLSVVAGFISIFIQAGVTLAEGGTRFGIPERALQFIPIVVWLVPIPVAAALGCIMAVVGRQLPGLISALIVLMFGFYQAGGTAGVLVIAMATRDTVYLVFAGYSSTFLLSFWITWQCASFRRSAEDRGEAKSG